jgi:hypothetical protein
VDDEPKPDDGAAEAPEPVVGPAAASGGDAGAGDAEVGALGEAAVGEAAVGAGPTAGAPADPLVARPLRSRYGSPGRPTAGRLAVVAESAVAASVSARGSPPSCTAVPDRGDAAAPPRAVVSWRVESSSLIGDACVGRMDYSGHRSVTPGHRVRRRCERRPRSSLPRAGSSGAHPWSGAGPDGLLPPSSGSLHRWM